MDCTELVASASILIATGVRHFLDQMQLQVKFIEEVGVLS